MKTLILAVALLSARAHAFSVGLGTLVPNFLSAQVDKEGGRRVFQFTPTLLVGGHLQLWGENFFTPRLGYATYLGEEDKTSKTDILLNYHMGYRFVDHFMLHYGFSTFITKLKGEGGTTTLSNGGGTATFYIPEESKTSYTSSIDVGGELLFGEGWSARADLFITRFLSGDRRKLNYMLSANYFF